MHRINFTLVMTGLFILLMSGVLGVAPTDYKYFWEGSSRVDVVSSWGLNDTNSVSMGEFYTFSGTNYMANRTPIPELNSSKNFTLSLWFNVTASSTDTYFFFASNSTDKYGASTSGGTLRVTKFGGDGSTVIQSLTWSSAISDNVWYNLIIRHNGTLSGFLNNVTNPATNVNSNQVGYTGFSLGATPIGTFTATASIDEVKIYDYWLTNDQVRDLYLLGRGSCTAVTAGKVFTSGEYTLCSGSYQLSSGIIVNESNTVIDGNSVFINYTNYALTSGVGVSVTGKENITIKNFNIMGFGSSCIEMVDYGQPGSPDYQKNHTIIYNNLSHCGGIASIYTSGAYQFNISNNRIYDSGNNGEGSLGSHGVYISSGNNDDINGGVISNNWIHNISATGVKINTNNHSAYNIDIYNNNITDYDTVSGEGDGIGVHISEGFNISIFDNELRNMEYGVIINNGDETPKYYSHNIDVYNNIITDMSVTGIDFRAGTYENYVYNNDYLSNALDFKITSTSNFTAYESDAILMGDSVGDYWFLKNFTGIGNFSLANSLLSIYSASVPYNDLKNLTSGDVLEYDFTDTSVLLSDNYYLAWGDYGGGNSCTYSGSGNWNITLSDNCTINTNTNLENNTLIFYGAGYVKLNATIQVQNWTKPVINQTIYILSNAWLY